MFQELAPYHPQCLTIKQIYYHHKSTKQKIEKIAKK